MTVMEPKLAERRKTVSEDRARKRLKWILVVIAVVALVVASMWLIRSPVFSIRQINVTGAQNSDPTSTVVSLGVGIGTPTIDVDGSDIEAALLIDPWVKSVDVVVSWPGSVAIDVVEYEGVAPVGVGDQWVLLSIEGVVLTVVSRPGPQDAYLTIDQESLTPGEIVDDERILGALVFLDQIARGSGVPVQIVADGEGLSASVMGHVVRLGRAVDMAQKAIVLETLLDSGLEPGAFIDLIAPLRPAVSNPQPVVEGEQ